MEWKEMEESRAQGRDETFDQSVSNSAAAQTVVKKILWFMIFGHIL